MTCKRILIIGGTGVFGKRLVRHLAQRTDVALFVTSRHKEKSENFIRTIAGNTAELNAVELDCAVNLQERLDALKPFIVVDCSGPFQGAGYQTARRSLESGAHFVDLADARDYLAGFSAALDELARSRGVVALTGASSTPTLSTCVAKYLTDGWARVDTIDFCITPGGKSEVGRAVIEAIMSYAGRDIPIWKQGRLAKTTGWGAPRIADVPGLGRRRVAAVETFDAEHLGPLLDVQSVVAFRAGLESRIEQWGIETIARLRGYGLIKGVSWFIPLLLRARRLTRLPTSDVGGMLVEISGLDANRQPCVARWSLIARQDSGPYVPILPAAAAIENLMYNEISPGARLGHTAVGLPSILTQARGYPISTETSQG